MNVVDVENINKGLAGIQSIMTEFSSNQWESYKVERKGPWGQPFHAKYQNYTMGQLKEREKYLIKEKLMEKEYMMQLLKRDNLLLKLKLSLKGEGQ